MTLITIWRHVSTSGDTHRHMATPIAIWRQASQRRDGRENLITFCCLMLYLCCPRDGYRDVISAGLSRFGDPRRRSVICVAVLRQLSPFRDSCRAMARHLVVQCKLSWPISPFRDRRGTAILAATAVAKVVQQAQYLTIYALFNVKIPALTFPNVTCLVQRVFNLHDSAR